MGTSVLDQPAERDSRNKPSITQQRIDFAAALTSSTRMRTFLYAIAQGLKEAQCQLGPNSINELSAPDSGCAIEDGSAIST